MQKLKNIKNLITKLIDGEGVSKFELEAKDITNLKNVHVIKFGKEVL